MHGSISLDSVLPGRSVPVYHSGLLLDATALVKALVGPDYNPYGSNGIDESQFITIMLATDKAVIPRPIKTLALRDARDFIMKAPGKLSPERREQIIVTISNSIQNI